jgi:hypothetical protein
VLGGNSRRSVGETIVRGQGLWAFIALVAAVEPRGAPRRAAEGSTATLLPPPATVCGALLAAWTDLVVAAARRPEVS